jgi:beta-N-acetylhexosaminidase
MRASKPGLKYILLFLSSFIFCSSYAQLHPCVAPNPWADSVLKTMTLDEKIGQLMIVSATSAKEDMSAEEDWINNYHVGGIIFFKGTPLKQALQTNYYQSISKLPLFIAIDGEWGLSMRLENTPNFLKQMQMGAMRSDSLVYEMGKEVGRECQRMGININFAPDVDINNNPLNPIIGDRSFGEERNHVAEYGTAYMKGMQEYHIIACAKHFPGHGDVAVDSHKDLPILCKTLEEMDSLELYPFKYIRDNGVMSMMVAHINMPCFDTTPNLPATLSPIIITDLLRKRLHFEGLIFTDALNMKGVTKYFNAGDAEWLALRAGADVLLCVDSVGIAIQKIKSALDSNLITEKEIDEHVLRILKAKYWTDLQNKDKVCISSECLDDDLNLSQTKLLIQKMADESVCIVNNRQQLLPIIKKGNLKIATLVIGGKKNNFFQVQLKHYAKMDAFATDKNFSAREVDYWMKKLSPYDVVIVSLHGTSRFLTRNYGITETEANFVNALCRKKKTILVNFSNAYSLAKFEDAQNTIEAFEEIEPNMLTASQIIFGLKPALGSLPVTVNENYVLHQTVNTTATSGMQYTIPEAVHMNSVKLNIIDTLALWGIAQKAYPGCQILVAKDGMVCYEKSFGTFTYDNDTQVVKNSNLFDLASVTKVTATNLAIMKLYDEKKIDLKQKLSFYLPELRKTNKKNITVRQVLLHEAGLKAWIPFYIQALKDSAVFSKTEDDKYTIQVADSMYMRSSYLNVMWKTIYNSPVTAPGKYVYSDLDFIFLKRLVEKQTGLDFETYIKNSFYDPLGLATTCYNPLRFFEKEDIVPTENDTKFRKQLLQGYVHDPAAAMFGGVAGHAGVFSDAYDLSIIFQMLLNKGTYNGVKYFNRETVDMFTSYQSLTSRRGLGFDKQKRKPKDADVMYNGASNLTFGHTGFTGISVWADPKYNLIFIFLSNRVNPDQDNDKILKLSVRSKIQQAAYDAMR